MPGRIPDRLPTTKPGLRIYGGDRHTDAYGNPDADDDDYQITLTTGLRHSLDATLPATVAPAPASTTILWSAAASPLATFLYGRIKGTGGTWYLEQTNAAGTVWWTQIAAGRVYRFVSGNTYNPAGPGVSAITLIRATVLVGAPAVGTDGYLVG